MPQHPDQKYQAANTDEATRKRRHQRRLHDRCLPNQLDKFKQAARELEADDDPERFDERIEELVKHKPVEKPE